MFFKILAGYIFGYVNIVVEGYFVERFINLCISKRIYLWNTKKEKSTILHASVNINDFRRLKHINKKVKCKIKIKNKKGIPFVFDRYKKRKIFAICLCLIFIGILSLSRFIWNIEVVCDEEIDNQEIINFLDENGLYIGAIKTKIDTSEIVNELRLQRQDIAWATIKIQGTNASVQIVKASSKPEIIQQDEYCNIISDKNGIITTINVQSGTALVKQGDIIKEGMMLVGGWMEGKYTGIRYMHSQADIQAKVWYSEKEKVSLNQVIARETGNVENKFSIKINNFLINFHKTLSKFEKYDTIIEKKKIKLFKDFYLPIEIIKTTNYELVEEEKNYTVEELQSITIPKLEEKLNSKIEQKENIVNKIVNVNKTDNYLEIELIYEVLESVGTKEKVIF